MSYDLPPITSHDREAAIRSLILEQRSNALSTVIDAIRPEYAEVFYVSTLDVEVILPESPKSQPVDWAGEDFKTIATTKPAQLLFMVGNGSLPEHDLTFAAEALGLVATDYEDWAVHALIALLRNTSALVREGAIYGLAKHATTPDVREELERVASADPSPGVREAAAEALE